MRTVLTIESKILSFLEIKLLIFLFTLVLNLVVGLDSIINIVNYVKKLPRLTMLRAFAEHAITKRINHIEILHDEGGLTRN